jgi:pyruvate kinase
MKIHIVGDILAKAQGIGRKSAFGKVVLANNAEEALNKVKEGSILVTIGSDREMVPAIEKCSALITQEGGLTSHAAVVGLNLGIPVLVGVENAMTLFKEGQEITVDSARGVIYNGHASVL